MKFNSKIVILEQKINWRNMHVRICKYLIPSALLKSYSNKSGIGLVSNRESSG